MTGVGGPGRDPIGAESGAATSDDRAAGSTGPAASHWPIRLAMGVLLVAPLLIVALFRLWAFGWAAVAPDDARYLNVGLSVLAGQGPLTPDGSVFLLRSPTYGVGLAIGARVVGGDPLLGARIVAASLTLLGFIAAARLGWVMRGIPGAAVTVAAILATPLLWRLVPTLRIDLVQAAAALGTILALRHPSARRWALAGALFGLSILIKETGALLGLVPVVWLGLVPGRRWLRLAAIFAGTAVLVAGWWWLFVWLRAGVLFPLNAIGVVERRDVAGALKIGRGALVLAGALGLSWLAVAWSARRTIDARLLLGAGVALVPPALFATLNGLSTRNYADLALLSCVAVAVAATDVLGALARRLPSPRPRWAGLAAAALAFVVLATPAVAFGQRQVGRPSQATLPELIGDWILARTATGGRVVMTFRMREVVALQIGDQVPVTSLPINRVKPGDDPAEFVWLGLRDRQLFGYRRDSWLAALGAPASRWFVTVAPHAFTPVELLALLGSPAGRAMGFAPAADLREGTDEAHVFALDPGLIGAGGAALSLHLSPEAAQAWLTLAAGDPADTVRRLAAARPIVVGDPARIDALRGALGAAACLTPAGSDEPPGAVLLGPC